MSSTTKNKIQFLIKLFIDKEEFKIVKIKFDEQKSLQELIPKIFVSAEIVPQEYQIKSFFVLNKKNDEYVKVAEEYLVQPFDKLQLYLIKKKQCQTDLNVDLKNFVPPKTVQSIDTSALKNMKDLSEMMFENLNFKQEETVLQKFDEDFNDYIPVEADEKFDATKTYKFQVTKTIKFDILVVPSVAAMAEEEASKKPIDEKLKEAIMDISDLFDKITPFTNEQSEVIEKYNNSQNFPAIADFIFRKVLSKPNLAGIYGDLCLLIHKIEQRIEGYNFQRRFHGALIGRLQKSFETTAFSEFPQSVTNLQEQIAEEKYKDIKVEQKEKMIGTLKFMAHVYRIDLLNFKIIENCIVLLIRNAENVKRKDNELMLEYVIIFMKEIGPFIVQKTEETFKLNGYISYLEKFKGNISNRIDLGIERLMDLRDRKWIWEINDPKVVNNVKMDEKQEKNADVRKQSLSNQTKKILTFVDPQYSLSCLKTDAQNFEVSPSCVRSAAESGESNDAKKLENSVTDTHIPNSDSHSFSTNPSLTDSSSKDNTVTFTPEDQFNKKAFKDGFKNILRSYDFEYDIDKATELLSKLNYQLNNPILFFEQMFVYGCEILKPIERNGRHAAAELAVKCNRLPGFANAFAPAFKKYCKFLVENNVESDVPDLKTTFPEFFASILTAEISILINEFFKGFKEFHASENYMFARTLAEIIFMKRTFKLNEILGIVNSIFKEFAQADPYYKSNEFLQILEDQPIRFESSSVKDYIEDF